MRNRVVSAVASLAMALPLSFVVAPVAHATGSTTNYSACADSYVDDGHTGTNYGSSTTLYTNDGDSSNQNTLIKFCSISIPTNVHVTSATLTFDVADGVGPGGTNGVEVKRLPRSSTWTESGVTWSNQPTNPYASYAGHFNYSTGDFNTFYSRTFDITKQVQMTNTTGDYAFQLTARCNGVDPCDSQAIFRSREATSGNTPVLTVVTADDTAPTITDEGANSPAAGQVYENSTTNPNGSMTTVMAQIADDSGFTTNLQCVPGCTFPTSNNIGQQPLENDTSLGFTGLTSGHTYYIRLVAQNYKGTTYGTAHAVVAQ